MIEINYDCLYPENFPSNPEERMEYLTPCFERWEVDIFENMIERDGGINKALEIAEIAVKNHPEKRMRLEHLNLKYNNSHSP